MFDISWMMKASNMGDSATSAIPASFILPTSKREQDCAVKPLRYFASRRGKSTLPCIMLVKGMFGGLWIEQQ